MIYLRLLAYKALDFLWTRTGVALSSAFGVRTVSLSHIDRIVINRADRLGDAIVSYPFLRCFIEQIRLNGWNGEVVVIASTYNKDFLLPLAEISNVRIEVVESDSMFQYDRSVLRVLSLIFWTFFRYAARIFRRQRSSTVFVDLIDSVTEMTTGSLPEYSNAFWMSSNRGPFTPLFDYCAKGRFAGSEKAGIIDAYIDTFSEFFQIPELRAYVESRSDLFYPKSELKNRNTLLIFVGVKDIRNFEIGVWERMIDAFSRVFPDYDIDVLDDKSHALLPQLEKLVQRANVRYVRNTFEYHESQAFAAEHGLIVGVDGGGINMMRPFTDSVTLFTLGNPEVWGPFPCGGSKEQIELSDTWIMESIRIRPDRTVFRVWKKSFWLPSFQLQLPRSFVSDFPIERFVEELRLTSR